MNIIEPTLIVSKVQVLNNINKIKSKAERNGIRFRPHFKTHQSIEVGKWLKKLGVKHITVSSVRMAECFAKAGWEDITIAFPVNILEIIRINNLAKSIQLNLLVESVETIQFLDEELQHDVDVWINIDTGYNRDGVAWDNHKDITRLAFQINKTNKMKLVGILTHAGHSYKARSKKEILSVHEDTTNKMVEVQRKLQQDGFDGIQISVGGTPTASVAEDFSMVDEIRPGNFVFYDLKQVQIGSCSEEEIAIRFACPVIAKYEERNEILIDGGAIHFSKDHLLDAQGRIIYGYLSQPFNKEFSRIRDAHVSSISQEHGTIEVSNNDFFQEIRVGDIVYIMPVHACLATNLMGKLITLTGKEISVTCR
ncbi:MAG: alanine racemase [Candidatus Heimdallarchaeota archaeon]|nr:alanine racemase [Candidatus Heimdallarchaeota archaeon]